MQAHEGPQAGRYRTRGPGRGPFLQCPGRRLGSPTRTRPVEIPDWLVAKTAPTLRAGVGSAMAPTGQNLQLARSMLASWGSSPFLDARHGKSDVACGACHGGGFPAQGDRVENDRCLACHGPADQLIAKTRPVDLPDRNPHASHLGEITCGTCHKAHRASPVYCLGCHPKFQMPIPGGPSEP